MRRGVAVVAAVVGLAPSAYAAERTPEGPATMINVYRGAHTAEGTHREVLTKWSVTVAPGGRSGQVRLRARSGLDSRGTQLGDVVELPAVAGTYTYPAPHLRWDPREGVLGLDQTAGGHAIVDRRDCQPELGDLADPCAITALRVFFGAPPPGERPTADQEINGARLAIEPVVEPDLDRDRLGDRTEDPDVRGAGLYTTTAAPRQRLADGIAVRVTPRHVGRARVVAAFRVRGRTLHVGRTIVLTPGVAQRVVLRPRGAILRSLRRAAARGPVTAQIRVAGSAGPRVAVV